MNWRDTLTTQGFSFSQTLYCGCVNKKKEGEKWSKGAWSVSVYTEKKKKWFRVKYYAQTKKTGNLTMGDNEDALLNAILGL